MNVKFSSKILCMFMTGLLLHACKKYPDGPLICFVSKAKRIKGFYDIQNYFINGADSLNTPGNYWNKYYISIIPDDGQKYFGDIGLRNYNSFISGNSYRWAFKDSYKDLAITNAISIADSVNFFKGQNTLWRILKLTTSELWLKNNEPNQRVYEIHLKKKN